MTDPDQILDALDGSGEIVLPTFVVLARFRAGSPDTEQAVLQVRGLLEPVADLYDDLTVERVEDDGTVMVLARFVTVAIDAGEAVNAVHATLRENGIAPDEAWVDRAL